MSIIDRYQNVMSTIHHSAHLRSDAPSSVGLAVVSKYQPATYIKQLYHVGQHDFAENYVQEALTKQQLLASLPLTWHFIGHIQSNKIRQIAQNFCWIQSLTKLKHVPLLAQYRSSDQPLNVCIQINWHQEPGKAGIELKELPAMVDLMKRYPSLRLRGLMILPKFEAPCSEKQAALAEIGHFYRAAAPQYGLDTLSLGTSGDFQAAIAHGATMVRLGTAIFGERTNLPKNCWPQPRHLLC